MRLLGGNRLIIGNRKFSVFEIRSYVLSLYNFETITDYYLLYLLFGSTETESTALGIMCYSVEEYYDLMRLFKEYGFSVVYCEEDRRYGNTFIKRRFYDPWKISSFSLPPSVGIFKIILYREEIKKYIETLSELSMKHAYKVIYNVKDTPTESLYCIK